MKLAKRFGAGILAFALAVSGVFSYSPVQVAQATGITRGNVSQYLNASTAAPVWTHSAASAVNTVVVWGCMAEYSAKTITATYNGVYAAKIDTAQISGGTTLSMFSAAVTTTNPAYIRCSWSGAAASMNFAADYQGVATTTADVSGNVTSPGTSSLTKAVTTVAANDMLVGIGTFSDGPQALSAYAGGTMVSSTDLGGYDAGLVQRLTTTAGSYTTGITLPTSYNGNYVVVALKPTASAPAAAAPRRRAPNGGVNNGGFLTF